MTARLTDFSGYWILLVSAALAALLLAFAPGIEPARLVTFANFSGPAGGDVWPATDRMAVLFALGTLLPAYTITGFDGSAHVSEETVGADEAAPRGIVRSVVVSFAVGWVLLSAVVLAAPDVAEAAARGEGAFHWILDRVLPAPLRLVMVAGIALAQYLCGLAALTSASRMAFAFARDGGLPFSTAIRRVCPKRRTPATAIWGVAASALAFTLYTPAYATITAVCAQLLYISYVLPTALGAVAYGRTWKAMGPWDLGPWFRPLAAAGVVGCVGLVAVGVQPPNGRSAWVVGGAAALLAAAWFGGERRRFPGPPVAALDPDRPSR